MKPLPLDLEPTLNRSYNAIISKELIFGSFIIDYKDYEKREYQLLDIRKEFCDRLNMVLAAHKMDIVAGSLKTRKVKISEFEHDIYTDFVVNDGTLVSISVVEDFLGQCPLMSVTFSNKHKSYSKMYDDVKTHSEKVEAGIVISQDLMTVAEMFGWQYDLGEES